jgi:hypothetical protein
MTLNKGLNDDETLWHLRSGWNVAALNCVEASQEPILEGYGAFLKKYERKLRATNTALDAQYRKELGSRAEGVKGREVVSTQVYNYFALPGARSGFCDTALAMSNEFLASPPDDPQAFAATHLPRLEAVFERFFDEYDKYRVDSAAWDARYGAMYGASQPGYVAVHGLTVPSVGSTLAEAGTPQLAGEVTDPETGAVIPIIPAPQETIATPVVQPVATPQGS